MTAAIKPARIGEVAQSSSRRLGIGLASTGLMLLLAASVVIAIGLGPAAIAPADTVRYLWAAVSGGMITADEVSTYQIVWQIRTPRVLLAAIVGAGLSSVGVAVRRWFATRSRIPSCSASPRELRSVLSL